MYIFRHWNLMTPGVFEKERLNTGHSKTADWNADKVGEWIWRQWNKLNSTNGNLIFFIMVGHCVLYC